MWTGHPSPVQMVSSEANIKNQCSFELGGIDMVGACHRKFLELVITLTGLMVEWNEGWHMLQMLPVVGIINWLGLAWMQHASLYWVMSIPSWHCHLSSQNLLRTKQITITTYQQTQELIEFLKYILACLWSTLQLTATILMDSLPLLEHNQFQHFQNHDYLKVQQMGLKSIHFKNKHIWHDWFIDFTDVHMSVFMHILLSFFHNMYCYSAYNHV